jgi:hypothetical protein
MNDYKIKCGDIISWYLDQKYDRKLPVYVPYVLDGIATSNSFELETLRVITYIGTSDVRMIHFAFKFLFQKGMAGKALSKSYTAIMGLPLYEAKNGKISICDKDKPKFYGSKGRSGSDRHQS